MVQIKKSGIESSKKNAGKVGRSLEFCGLGDKRKAVSIKVDSLRCATRGCSGRKSVYGIRGLLDRYDLFELQQTWGGFLKGETLYIPENVLVVRSWAGILPDRKAGEKLAREIASKGNPFFGFTGKMDQCLDVDAEIVEDSMRVSYFRIERLVQPKQKRKVTMKITFALKVRLKNPLRELPANFMDNPYVLEGDDDFYRVLKALLDHPEEYLVDFSRGYVCRKPRTTEEGNRVFALNFGLFLNDSARYGSPVSVMGPFSYCLAKNRMENSNANRSLFNSPMGLVHISLQNPSEDFLDEDGVEQMLDFVKEVFCDWRSLKYIGRRDFSCCGVRMSISLPNPKSNFAPKPDYASLVEQDLNSALSFLNEIKNAMAVGKNSMEQDSEWNSLMGSSDYFDEPFGRLVYKSAYARNLAKNWIKKVSLDPVMFVDSVIPVVADFAKSNINGGLYGA